VTKRLQISRREFVSSAISTAAVGSLPLQNLIAISRGNDLSASDSAWKDEGILFVEKSPYARLHNVPVHAVTITHGFWGVRREINVDKSIPSMEKLLEANGRMSNYLRLAGKSEARSTRTLMSISGRKPSASRCSLAIVRNCTRMRTGSLRKSWRSKNLAAI
jgi:hypothetical protein